MTTFFLIQLIALPLLASILGPPRCHHCCRAFSHPVPLSSRPLFVRPAKSSNPVIMAAETTPPGDHHHRAVVDEDDDDYDDYDDDDNEEEEEEGSSPPAWYTPLPSIGPLVSEAHATYRSGRTRPLAIRDAQLRGVERLVRDNAGALCRAVRRDLGQSRNYVELFELDLVSSRCRVARASLGGWASTSRVPTPWPHYLAAPVRSEVVVEPRGVATLITPWNMPVLLALSPLVDALAAGNVCVLKMSELSRHTTRLLTDLLSSGEYVDADVVRVVNGGADVGSELLRHRVDAISYTGGGGVGRIVAAAAARHLTPTLLELGGKNPCIVTGNAHVRSAARRIAWGKITGNAGQMCICPDYVRFVCVPAVDVAFSFLFLRVPHFHDNAPLTQPRAHRALPVLSGTRGGDREGGIRRRAVQGHGRVLPGFQLRRRRRGRRRRDRTRTSTRGRR